MVGQEDLAAGPAPLADSCHCQRLWRALETPGAMRRTVDSSLGLGKWLSWQSAWDSQA